MPTLVRDEEALAKQLQLARVLRHLHWYKNINDSDVSVIPTNAVFHLNVHKAIYFLFLHKTICCGYSLEASR